MTHIELMSFSRFGVILSVSKSQCLWNDVSTIPISLARDFRSFSLISSTRLIIYLPWIVDG